MTYRHFCVDNSMERDGVWIPMTPVKSALTSENGSGEENINEDFRCTECFDSVLYTEKCVINEMCEFPTGILDELEEVFVVAGKDLDSTTGVQGKPSLL